jgi:phage terminase large subunit
MCSEMQKGSLLVCHECKGLIKEIESYVWDPKASEKGEDRPLKKDDHALDALRYAVYTHKITTYDYEMHAKLQQNWMQNRFQANRNF